MRRPQAGGRTSHIILQRLSNKGIQKKLRILEGRGVLFAVADDVKLLGPPEVIAEMAEGFPSLTWEEAGLTT